MAFCTTWLLYLVEGRFICRPPLGLNSRWRWTHGVCTATTALCTPLPAVRWGLPA